MRSTRAVTLFLLASLAQLKVAISSGHNCSVLHLLNVQPFPDGGDFSGLDIGLSLIPAAHIAEEEINNRSDILNGYHLKVIDVQAEACGRTIITDGVVNLYRELLSRECLVGVMGFVCSTSTNALAPTIGHPPIGYVTLANSVTPQHRNTVKYPNLFHTLESTGVHSRAIISLMQTFNWTKIALVSDTHAIFSWSTAVDFAQKIHSSPDIELTTHIHITNLLGDIKNAFDIINSKEARISYWIGNKGQYAHFLCEAYKRQFLWPGYVYIVRNTPNIITTILKANTTCSNDNLLRAMEGVFLLDYRTYVDNATQLFSGWTYKQFRQRYINKLNKYNYQFDRNISEITYASSFYDQVWTFALAINNSLPSIYIHNLSFSDYTFRNTKTISNIIKRELLNLSFQGASGYIKFDHNQEIHSLIDIMQIQNGHINVIGCYNSSSMNITALNLPKNIPPDSFETIYYLFSFKIKVCIFTVNSLLLCLITVNMLLTTYWKNEREIKATSYTLSMLLIISCYLQTTGSVIWTVYKSIIIHNAMLHTVLCNTSLWLSSIGLDLLLATLLFRLFRVVHIFRIKPFQRHNKYLSDKFIALYVLLTCSIKVIILLTWSLVDLHHSSTIKKYDPIATPPVYRAIKICTCNDRDVWFIASYLFSAGLLFLVMFFAFQSRRIRKTAFKDTKKVNVFLFLITITQVTLLTLRAVFSNIDIQIGADISEWIGYCSVPILCQLCLVIPKLLPLAVKKYKYRGGNTLSREYSLYSEFDGIRLIARRTLSKLAIM